MVDALSSRSDYIPKSSQQDESSKASCLLLLSVPNPTSSEIATLKTNLCSNLFNPFKLVLLPFGSLGKII